MFHIWIFINFQEERGALKENLNKKVKKNKRMLVQALGAGFDLTFYYDFEQTAKHYTFFVLNFSLKSLEFD